MGDILQFFLVLEKQQGNQQDMVVDNQSQRGSNGLMDKGHLWLNFSEKITQTTNKIKGATLICYFFHRKLKN